MTDKHGFMSDRALLKLEKRIDGTLRQYTTTIKPRDAASLYNKTGTDVFHTMGSKVDTPLNPRTGDWEEEVAQGYAETHFVNEERRSRLVGWEDRQDYGGGRKADPLPNPIGNWPLHKVQRRQHQQQRRK